MTATNSTTNATYLKIAPIQLHVTGLPCPEGEEFSLIIPNASTQGPPTSSAVQVNLGNFIAGYFTVKLPANRVRGACIRLCCRVGNSNRRCGQEFEIVKNEQRNNNSRGSGRSA